MESKIHDAGLPERRLDRRSPGLVRRVIAIAEKNEVLRTWLPLVVDFAKESLKQEVTSMAGMNHVTVRVLC
jgi:hypothetical protein